MRIKATFSYAYDDQGAVFFPKIGEIVPLTPKMANLMRLGSSSSAVSDYVSGEDVSKYNTAKLISKGDVYNASVWEVMK